MEYVYDEAAFSEIYIPRTVTSISDYAFMYNTDLKKISFAEGSELTGVVIPSSVKSIDSGMYSPFFTL